MKKLGLSWFTLGPVGLLCLGCQAPPQPTGECAIRISAADVGSGDALWNAAQETLRHARFRLDRVDEPAGVITTLPETSKHYFEFWRNDAVTGYDVLESTINPIRRWVEVHVAPAAPDNAERVVTVTVHKERLSSPDRQFNNSTAAYRFFGESLPSTTGIVRVTAEHDQWLAMGRDGALEDRLGAEIARRTGGGDRATGSIDSQKSNGDGEGSITPIERKEAEGTTASP